ncbi:hypothetical protein BU63_19750 [Escherichia coli O118:H16 str. 07-4255]|nr:hypothetical protein BU59_12200 [Escherichia coli O69:H11 str. 07-3763]KDV74232.1 hypothetical protein BU63_19750 [Escherichia coli O118:H16 str. 07-4255]
MRFVHAGCGVNALSGLQKHANSIDCRDYVDPDKRSASGNFAFVISLERVSLLARFFYALLLLKCLMPNHQCNQADHHQTTQCAGQNKLPTHPLTAANKFIIVMIAITLGIDIPNETHLFVGLAM